MSRYADAVRAGDKIRMGGDSEWKMVMAVPEHKGTFVTLYVGNSGTVKLPAFRVVEVATDSEWPLIPTAGEVSSTVVRGPAPAQFVAMRCRAGARVVYRLAGDPSAAWMLLRECKTTTEADDITAALAEDAPKIVAQPMRYDEEGWRVVIGGKAAGGLGLVLMEFGSEGAREGAAAFALRLRSILGLED